ncbi:MAG TPA: dicarboxylate/amino acid:cation symporter [Verrucomicrobiales bacterium]|nr:dicarboxylate/amino acid:cation symporter [Verrucomicrobiales bacterium]
MSAPANSDRLANRILIGLVAGVVAGVLIRTVAHGNEAWMQQLRWVATQALDPFGQVFLRLLFFAVVPLVFSSLMLGVVQLGRLDLLGPMAARTFGLFVLNMSVAVALGLLVMNTFIPGDGIDGATRDALLDQFQSEAQEKAEVAKTLPTLSFAYLVELFMPRNLLRAVVDFQILPLILFAILLGAAGTQLAGDQRVRVQSALEIATTLATRLVNFALKLAPYAVPAMIVSVCIKAGASVLQSLAVFVALCLAAMLVHLFGTMSVLLKLFTRIPPGKFFRAVRAIIVTAFSTSSSNATLPTTIQITRDKLGVSNSTASFVLPLGATMNMSGTALYEGCVVLFLAQVYGVQLALGQQVLLLILTVLSAVAVAGVPGASLPLIVGLLANFGVPAEGIALIIGVDRILDMARTVLNVSADAVTAVIVDEWTRPATEALSDGP